MKLFPLDLLYYLFIEYDFPILESKLKAKSSEIKTIIRKYPLGH